MKNNFSFTVLVFLLSMFLCTSAQAQIQFTDPDDVDGLIEILSNSQGQLFRGNKRFKLEVECNDPQNNLSGNFNFALAYDPNLGGPLLQIGDTGSKEFSLNCNGTGKKFSQNINLTSAGQEVVKMATELGESFNLPVNINFIGDNDPGFQTLNFELSMTSSDDTGGSTEPVELKDGLVDVVMPDFGTYNINNLENGDTDLKITYDLKIDTLIYNNFVSNLDPEANLEDALKDLADELGLKVNMRNLRKLARQQVRAAGRGLRGEEKEAAEQEARETGVTQLVDTIVGKLPPLPSSQTSDPEERERLRRIRRARKNNLLQGLEIQVESNTEETVDGVALRCIKFCITLPIRLCAADSDDGSTLIFANGRRYRLRSLNPGETITANVPVKVVGAFKKFFGKTNKKGKRNGKTTIPIVITNPAP